MRHAPASLMLLLLLGTPAALASSTTLRCGSGLVSTGSTTEEVHQLCGKPISRDRLGSIIKTGHYGERYELQVEEWSYGPRNGMYQFLRFEGGRLVRVESKRVQ
ncbi:DUF2845 domain-containing protein [Pseudomonas sp. N040]|uniref:DUF2845 domain-containing protein n=1 Tax=Pseudomonas sp. N040 TaxID=2785325 RepID=UPI0018A32533|nr:DUF2845 domain-containing protein [Pseudomonas sp. N040]MBF7729581.1 DUF2845 domain-containing protein [Pseudomonas sp. N040]MBW7013221.1 DUF2845 domain-containing protein [Pseudomonas sp. N040]